MPLVGARRVELRQAGAWSALRARVNRLRLRSLGGVLSLMVTFACKTSQRQRARRQRAPGPRLQLNGLHNDINCLL